MKNRFAVLLIAAVLALNGVALAAVPDAKKRKSIQKTIPSPEPETSQPVPDTPPPPVPKFSTVNAVVNYYGKSVREKLKPIFKANNVEYPPKEMTWICLKQEKMFYVFGKDRQGKMKQLLKYQIIGASGGAGPKLKEGDKQVPEGFYSIDGFRPNLVAHIGMSVNYPNAEDRQHAIEEKRSNLGCDILIHGSRWSTGCLAMGNEPIEELFVLAHDTGKSNIKLIFAPCNLLVQNPDIDLKKQPKWLPPLYENIRQSLKMYF